MGRLAGRRGVVRLGHHHLLQIVHACAGLRFLCDYCFKLMNGVSQNAALLTPGTWLRGDHLPRSFVEQVRTRCEPGTLCDAQQNALGEGKQMSEQALTSGGIRPTTSHATAAPAHINIPFKEALLVALAAGLGYGFDAYAVNIFGMLGPTLAHDLNVSIKTIGLIGSIFLVGYTIGTIGFGYLADRIGRRDTLGYSIVLYGLTTALGGISLNLYIFTSLRFLTGIGGRGNWQ